MLSEMIECPNPYCKGGMVIEVTSDLVTMMVKCRQCNGKGYIVQSVCTPPGADFFADESEAG